MGLDIYAYKYKDFAKTQDLEKRYEEESKKTWDPNGRKYEELAQEEKDGASERAKEFALSLGLDESGSDEKGKEQIEIDSKKYPEHYFKIGYFRSSYNAGGINTVLGNLLGKDLHYIFQPDEEYYVQPDWEDAKTRTQEMISELKEVVKNGNTLRVESICHNELIGLVNNEDIDDEKKALNVFLKEKKDHEKGPLSYENRRGSFFLEEPLKVRGFILGARKRFFVDQKLPCVYAIYESDVSWYLQALEIVEETIDYILALPDKDKVYLHWSG